MATAPTLTLCDALVEYLTTQVAEAGAAPNSVRREYFIRIADKDDEALEQTDGRRVTIAPTLPNAYSYEGHTRGEDLYTHQISVLVTERYPETVTGDATRAWLDERVNWVYTNVVLLFDFDKRSDNGPSFNRNLVTLSAEVQLFDLDTLVGRGKLFLSQVDLTFHEIVDA